MTTKKPIINNNNETDNKNFNTHNSVRSRRFILLLYPDNNNHMDALERIKQSYEHIFILHDKDTTADGEIKKAHIHCVLQFKNAKWSTAISKELNIELKFIQEVRNEVACLEYLIHYNEETKHHYEISEIQGSKSIIKKLRDFIAKDGATESEKIKEIMNAIFSCGCEITIKDVTEFVLERGYFDVYRRCLSLWFKLIEENNRMYSPCEDRYKNNYQSEASTD